MQRKMSPHGQALWLQVAIMSMTEIKGEASWKRGPPYWALEGGWVGQGKAWSCSVGKLGGVVEGMQWGARPWPWLSWGSRAWGVSVLSWVSVSSSLG